MLSEEIFFTPLNVKHTEDLINLLSGAIDREESFKTQLNSCFDIGLFVLDKYSQKFIYSNNYINKLYNKSEEELSKYTLNCLTILDYQKTEVENFSLFESNNLSVTSKIIKATIQSSKITACVELVEFNSPNFPYIFGLLIDEYKIRSWNTIINRATKIIS